MISPVKPSPWQLTMSLGLFLVVMTSTSSSAWSSSWEYLPQKHSRPVGDVTLKASPTSHVPERSKRHADMPDPPLPSTLTFTFTVGGDGLTLTLQKNNAVDWLNPLYVVSHGKITAETVEENLQSDHAYYQDRESGAAVMVRRQQDSQTFQVTGTYFKDGEEYSIQPIKSRDGNDVDHRISKLFHEANLQHDVIDFGSELLHAVSMDERVVESMNSENQISTDSNSTKLEDKKLRLSNNTETDDVDNTTINNADVAGTFKEKSRPITPGENRSTGAFKMLPSENKSVSMVVNKKIRREVLDGNFIDVEGNIVQDNSEKMADNSTSVEEDSTDDPRSVGSDDEDADDEGDESEGTEETKDNEDEGKWRRKRQAKSYVVELQMVIDYGVYEIWYQGVTDLEGDAKRKEALRRIRQFYSFVLNGIDLRYSSVSRLADITMDVTWAGMIVFDTPDPEFWKDTEKAPTSSRDFVESSAALEAFRAWAESQGTTLPPSDHVMLFTGHNLTYGGSVSNAGLAYLGSACNPEYYFSIVEEFFEFRDVAIAAHELGHSLGARHDMDGNTCLSFNRYIMTSRFKFPSKRKAQNPWLFSQCSVEYFTDFIAGLDKNDTNCLVTREAKLDNKDIQPFLVSFPGEVYAGDDFCRLGDGSESYICRDQHVKDYSNVCYGGIYCYRPADKQCVPKLPPDGFSCGNRKWCINGTCQFSSMAPATMGDDCPFGDDPGLIGGQTCAERMLTSRYDCYRNAFRAKCCASCRRYRRNLPGCEFGDMFELCKKEQCANYEEDYARENCCDTCAELLFTIPTTIETTTTPYSPTPTKHVNTTKKGDVTSRQEERTHKESNGQNQVTSPNNRLEKEGDQSAERGGEGEVGQGRRARTNNRRTRYRYYRRNDDDDSNDSDESDDSDEISTSQDFRRRNNMSPDYDSGRNGRFALIRTLLDGMRNSRHMHKSQRMRILLSVLDKMRREERSNLLSDWGEETDDATGVAGAGTLAGGRDNGRQLVYNGDGGADVMMDDKDESDSDSSNESR